ncbi:MAG: hypothetical protein PWR20_239 [Bacteroidales bacterium]|jgi:hypothetical protein|nr:hypothetical protein [Bacteroidales bacterium]MDN5328399.1 hypothetical protein [Bacteroidales bacterium]
MAITKATQKPTNEPRGNTRKNAPNPKNKKKDDETIYWVYFFIFLAISLFLLYLFRY